MSNDYFAPLGEDYFVQPSEDPNKALDHAASLMGAPKKELMQNGWGGPIHQFIHHQNVRDIIIQHDNKVWIRDKRGQKSILPVKLNTQWIDFLAYHWRYAKSTKQDSNFDIDPLASFRGTVFFPQIGGGVRFQYVGSAFSALGSSIYIRQLPQEPLDLSLMVANDTLPQAAADMLKTLIKVKTPIIISGQTGSGKTTFLGSLVQELQRMNDPLNMLVVEKSHEIPLIRPAYRWEEDADGLVKLQELASHATQMGLEWLILGECTGPEAYYIIKAFTQGVPVITTLHAISATEGYRALVMLALEYVREPSLLPSLMKSLANEAVVSINLEVRERPDGSLLGAVSGIEEIISVSGDKPVVNPLWMSKENKETGLLELVFNRGCVAQLSPATKLRFKVADIPFPIPETPKPAKKAIPEPAPSKSRGLFGRK